MLRSNFPPPIKKAAILILTVLIFGVINSCGEKNEYVEPPAPEVTVSTPLVKNVTEYLEFTGIAKAIDVPRR